VLLSRSQPALEIMTEHDGAAARTAQTPLQKLVGLSMWAPGLTWLTAMMSTLMVAQRFYTADQLEWLTRVYTRGQLAVLGTRVRYEVHPEVDPQGVYMFVQNHVNLLDHCTCYNATPHFKQGVELAAHFEIPVYGWFMRQRGTIPVHRDASLRDQHRSLAESIRAEVHRGHSILVFPEGTRTLDGRVGPFRTGLFRIAHALELPIVPVAVTGMFEVLRKGRPYIHPGKRVTVYVERPVETKGRRKSELPLLIEQVQHTIANRVDAYYAERSGTDVTESRLDEANASRRS
jgi:1-acyl-sn-glycerol-3-phosphate acyltransferase